MSARTAALGEVLDLLTDGTHYTPPDVGTGLPFLTVKDISESGLDFVSCARITEAEFNLAAKQNSAPKAGDVLFSKDGTVGKVHLVRDEGQFAVLSSLAILRCSKHLEPAYLAHYLRWPRTVEAAGQKKTGSAIRRIVLRDLGTLSVPLPPLDEQRRIAAILDKADALRRKRKRALELLDGLTAEIFQTFFSGQRSPSLKLSEIVKSGTIVTYGIVQAGEEFDGGVPYIRTGDISNGQIRVDGLRHTDPAIAAKFDRSRVRAAEIVMSIRATVGTTAIVPPELDGANLTQGTARIAPGEKISLHYLLNFLRSTECQAWLQAQVKGATFREITLTRLRELGVPVPAIELQEQFEKQAIKVSSQIQLTKLQLTALDANFASLQHRAFCGQL